MHYYDVKNGKKRTATNHVNVCHYLEILGHLDNGTAYGWPSCDNS